PPTPSPLPKEVERETEATKDKVQTINLGSIAHVQPPVVQVPIPEPDVAPKPNPKPSIPYPSRLNDQKLREKANNQMLKFLQIFQRLHFDLSFADALLHIPKFASTFKSLLSNKEKLFELANTLLNENCSAVILKKLPKKLGDPDRFLIPCDFPELVECLALANLGASINLMPLSVWNKLSLPELTLTRMTLELANRSFAYPIGVVEDVFVKVGKFHFLADFVVVDYDVDPRLKIKKLSHHLSGSTTSSPNSYPSHTPVETSNSLLEEFVDELALLDPFPPGIGDADFDPEGDILLLDKLLNDDPSWGNFMTFSNPLFDANEDFTSSDDESPLEADVPEENFKIYSNPLFEFDKEYISSDVNPLFNEELEDIESNDSYVSNLNEPVLSVTPLSDANEDECFDLGGDIDEIDAFLVIDVSTDIEDGYYNSEGAIMYLENLLNNDTVPYLPPEVFLDHDPRILKDELDNNDLKSMVKVFDPSISTYSFYSLEPVAYESLMEVCSSTCFVPNITIIWGEIAPDYEESRARGLSIAHSIFNPSHAYIWESDILDLID
ncbi:reverse transcriptase domain-containing protein, partial [Tanacetum coccineum]